MAPPVASLSPVCCVPFPASAPRRASPSSTRRLPRLAARSGGGGSRPEPKPGDNESKAVLDAFFLGKAFAEALTERVESVVGEMFSVVGQWQAEFQEEVVQRAQKAKERAATEVPDDKGPKTLREPSATIETPAPTTPSPATPTQAE